MMWERFRDRVVAGGGEVALGAARGAARARRRAGPGAGGAGPDGEERVPGDLASSPACRSRSSSRPRPAGPGGGAGGRAPACATALPDRGGPGPRSAPSCSPTTGSTSTTPRCGSAAIQNFSTGARPWCPTPRSPAWGSSTSATRGTPLGACRTTSWSRSARRRARAPRPRPSRRGRGRRASFRQSRGLPGLRRDLPRPPRRHLATTSTGFPNLQTVGRNGLHRYNNQDHSMLTGIQAARELIRTR